MLHESVNKVITGVTGCECCLRWITSGTGFTTNKCFECEIHVQYLVSIIVAQYILGNITSVQ